MLGLAPTWASSHNIQPEPCPQGVPQWGKRALGVTIPTLFGLFQEEKCHPQLTTQRPGVKVSALPRTSGNQPCWEQPFRTHRPKAVSSLFRQLPVLGSWEWEEGPLTGIAHTLVKMVPSKAPPQPPRSLAAHLTACPTPSSCSLRAQSQHGHAYASPTERLVKDLCPQTHALNP